MFCRLECFVKVPPRYAIDKYPWKFLNQFCTLVSAKGWAEPWADLCGQILPHTSFLGSTAASRRTQLGYYRAFKDRKLFQRHLDNRGAEFFFLSEIPSY